MKKQTRNSKPKVDLTGKQFTYLTPLYYIKGGKWHCQCKCGNEVDVDTRNLNSGHTRSCGCLQKEKASNNTINMIGFENEFLKVIDRAGSTSEGNALWKCLCKRCGNFFITQGTFIRREEVHSCGCLHSLNESNIQKMLEENNIEYATQYTFPDLKGDERALRFDFAIFNHNKLSHLIEYNGKQHYEQPKGNWGSIEKIQKYDNLKKEYCKKNNIPLIIIKYDENYSIKDLLI